MFAPSKGGKQRDVPLSEAVSLRLAAHLQEWPAQVITLAEGVDVRALADYLGHADPGFTLRVYRHLMAEAEDKARRAVDRAFGGVPVDGSSVPNLFRVGD